MSIDAHAPCLEKDPSNSFKPEKIDTIHFLIHPGFSTDPRVRELSPEEDLWAYKPLLSKYVESASRMNPQEIMMAFLHASSTELREDVALEKPYTQTLHELKNVLGDRFIALSSDFDIFNSHGAIRTSIKIARGRGFLIHPRTTNTVGYGETPLVCVIDGAENLNFWGCFKSKTRIIPELTIPETDIERIKLVADQIKKQIKSNHQTRILV
jgi:hypothetical protein